nr:hypothetical protein [Tanacetum cinerariifolium]
VKKSSAEYTEDNSNDEDNEDSHSAEEEQNTEDSESVKTPPVKKHGRPKKIVMAKENKSSSVKRRGRPRKSNDESKKQTIGSKRKGREYKVDDNDDDDNDGTKKMKKESKISDENKKNSKIRTRTTPTALFNAMDILNGDRKKCLHEMGFGSMIGMGMHELPGKLGFYVIDNLDTETNVISLTDNSILVTSQSVHDIFGIPMGGCSLESLAPRSPDDPFIKEWFSQFGEKNEVWPNDITNVIVSTKDAGKLFKMNFLMTFMIPDCKKLNKLIKKFEEDFNKKDLLRKDENDDTTVRSIRENKCVEIRLTFKRRAWRKKSVMDNESKDAEAVELSSSIKSCGHPMKHSYHIDVKDVNEPIAEKINNEDQDAEETPFEFADRKDEKTIHNVDTSKNVNEKCTTKENTNVEQADTQVETTEIINECHIDVDCSKNEKETSRNTDSAFDDIRDEENNDDSELSNNADGKSEKEDEEFDAFKFNASRLEIINIEDSDSEKEEFDFGGETNNEEKYDPKKHADYKGEFYKSPYELKPIEPKIRVSASEKLVADTLVAMMYKPREIVFETYEGFKVLAIKMETMATCLDVHYEVINAWSDVLNTIEKDRKDDDKTMRKYCFKTKFLHFYVICFDLQSGSFVLIENNCVKNDSADRDLGITKALHSVFVDFMQSIKHRSYKKFDVLN